MINRFAFYGLVLMVLGCNQQENTLSPPTRPNILFAIADDQSYPYTSIYGSRTLSTPAFDQVAKNGVLFRQAFCAAPQCSPSRAAILTGRNIWSLEEAGTHSSYFPKKLQVFTDSLERVGYQLGYTGKPWGPGNWKDAGWTRNPVGPAFNTVQLEEVPYKGISHNDYAGNFKLFLDSLASDEPFFFWFGAFEPHRVYEEGSGLAAGKSLQDAEVPAFLPNEAIVQSDILDYAVEVEWFDQQLQQMMDELAAIGELENTIIVVTADNGMAFPYAKANLSDYGTHVPLAISGPGIQGGRVSQDLVSLIDLAPTFLEMAGLKAWPSIVGKSLLNILHSDQEGIVDTSRAFVYTGRERHTHARPDNLSYPSRAIRSHDYLYIRNFKPDRWPAGDPPLDVKESNLGPDFKPISEGYSDIDPSPTKSFIIAQQDSLKHFFDLGFAKRSSEELYDIRVDPGCTKNLAGQPALANIQDQLRQQLEQTLKAEGDPRMTGNGSVFESYPRFGKMRMFAGFRERGQYNKAYQQK